MSNQNEFEKQVLKDLYSMDCNSAKTGSGWICNPPPKGSDVDYVVCTFDLIAFGKAHEYLKGMGFTIDGEDEEIEDYEDMMEQFVSYRKGNLNLIVTNSREYFKKFKAATKIAKLLNLQEKNKRIALFQAILYGRNEHLYKIDADNLSLEDLI